MLQVMIGKVKMADGIDFSILVMQFVPTIIMEM